MYNDFLVVETEWIESEGYFQIPIRGLDIFIVKEGLCPIYIEKELHILQQGDCVIFDKQSDYSLLFPLHHKAAIFHAYVQNAELDDNFEMLDLPKKCRELYLSDFEFLIQNLTKLKELEKQPENQIKNELYRTLAKTIILSIKNILQPDETPGEKKHSKITKNTRQFIQEHYNEDLTLSDIASEMNFSIYYLSHIFKKEMGISPIQYLTIQRIERAKELLANTNLTVSAVAEEVGYDNANYFNLLFKKCVGTTPGAFRKNFSVDSDK